MPITALHLSSAPAYRVRVDHLTSWRTAHAPIAQRCCDGKPESYRFMYAMRS